MFAFRSITKKRSTIAALAAAALLAGVAPVASAGKGDGSTTTTTAKPKPSTDGTTTGSGRKI